MDYKKMILDGVTYNCLTDEELDELISFERFLEREKNDLNRYTDAQTYLTGKLHENEKNYEVLLEE